MLPTSLKNNPFFDELAAEKEVSASLLRELKRRNTMSQLLKLADGSVVRVHGEVEPVSVEELQEVENELLREVDNVRALITQPAAEAPAVDAPAATEQPEQPEAPVVPEQPTEAVSEAPVAAEQPAVEQPVVPAPEVTVSEPAPVDQPAPAEQPAEAPVIQ